MSKQYGGPLGWLYEWNARRIRKRRWQRELLAALAEDDAAIMEALSRLLEQRRVEETLTEDWREELERRQGQLTAEMSRNFAAQSALLPLELDARLNALEERLMSAIKAALITGPMTQAPAERTLAGNTKAGKLAYAGHSYHRVTGSTRFLIDLLATEYDVTTFWNDAWRQGPELEIELILRGGFDAVVVFQDEPIAARLARAGHPNITFFPMYDGSHGLSNDRWEALKQLKIVNFGRTLHERLVQLGLRSHHIQYYPDPAGLPTVDHAQGLSGFFWQRQQDITWRTIRTLLGDAVFSRFTLHCALDPTFGTLVVPPPEDVERYRLRQSDWFPDREAALENLASHNTYFAPRLHEGIGQSFLEAMAMGFLVVAPNRPTMNEYIVSGFNGLLYDPDNPAPLDFSRAADLGRQARRSAELGHAKWLRATDALLEFVRSPTA